MIAATLVDVVLLWPAPFVIGVIVGYVLRARSEGASGPGDR